MDNNTQQLRSALKGSSIMGAVQLFQLLITLLKAKLIALILGPAGMGVSALLITTLALINQATSLGLSLGAMRSISLAHASKNPLRIATTATTFRKLVLFTGLLGALLSALLSPLWSTLTFGNTSYTVAFIIFAPVLLLMALGSAEVSLLQGTAQLRKLARTSLLGSLVGLLLGIPLYYLLGTQGIAPAMLLLTLTTYLSNRHFTRSIPTATHHTSLRTLLTISKPILLIGLAMTFSTLLTTLTTFILNTFIRANSSLVDVGLFQAATSITTQYASIFLTALTADYLPRISAISTSNSTLNTLSNQQSYLTILLLAPLTAILLIFTPQLITLLLSPKFLPAVPLVRWMSLAIFLRLAALNFSYIAFAKGDKRTFFLLDGLFANAITMTLSLAGFILYGLQGLGIASLLSQSLYLILTLSFTHRRYQCHPTTSLAHTFLVLLFMLTLIFLITFLHNPALFGSLPLLLISLYCYYHLNRRLKLTQFIKNLLHRKL